MKRLCCLLVVAVVMVLSTQVTLSDEDNNHERVGSHCSKIATCSDCYLNSEGGACRWCGNECHDELSAFCIGDDDCTDSDLCSNSGCVYVYQGATYACPECQKPDTSSGTPPSCGGKKQPVQWCSNAPVLYGCQTGTACSSCNSVTISDVIYCCANCGEPCTFNPLTNGTVVCTVG